MHVQRLVRRLRRRPNIEPALDQRIVFAEYAGHIDIRGKNCRHEEARNVTTAVQKQRAVTAE